MPSGGDVLAPTPRTITVECRFFARYAQALGRDALTLELPASATVADAVRELRRALPAAGVLPERPLAAVNREHASLDGRLAHGDELAFLPPLAGG
ncbi:MAG: MoaD/ThiS family protein [Gemmatimonadota bacterium]|nr:MAG: MoaD/ThiS family protein [Gemmatimonadota bacterium]